MKKYLPILFSSLLFLLLSACTNDEIVSVIPEPEPGQSEEYSNGTAIMTMEDFLPGDAVTRASLVDGENGLIFGWDVGDSFAVFPTREKQEDGSLKPNDSGHTNSIKFTGKEGQSGLAITTTTVGMPYHFDENYLFSTFFPYRENVTNYQAIPFDFSNQTQKGYVNMGAFYGTGQYFDNPDYQASALTACKHLGENDVLISPEMTVEKQLMGFRLSHVGAIAKFFLLAPAQKLKMKKLMLVCGKDGDNKIFYTKGTVSLLHPNKTTTDFQGVALPQASLHQLTPDEASRTDHLELNFDDGENDGVWNMYPSRNASPGEGDKDYGNYFMSYLMMYPIITTAEDKIFIYVIAEDEDGQERKFKTAELAPKRMSSGYLYQWTEVTESINPIELTATLQSWQEIASGTINIGGNDE